MRSKTKLLTVLAVLSLLALLAATTIVSCGGGRSAGKKGGGGGDGDGDGDNSFRNEPTTTEVIRVA